LKNDIISCLGQWERISLEEERDEDEKDRFTNPSLFLSFRNLQVFFFLNFGREAIVEKLPKISVELHNAILLN